MTDQSTPSIPLEVQVDGQTPQAWGDILTQFEDASIYQTWAYGAVRWGERSLSHLVLRRKGEVVGAAQVRIAKVPLIPAGVAYLRWGPLSQIRGRPLDPSLLAEVVAHLRQEYVKRRGLVLQVIPPAFDPGDRAMAFHCAFEKSGLSPEPSLGLYRTVLVDLAPSVETIRKHLEQKWRNQLNRAERNGLDLETSETPVAYRQFVQLYEGMWERKRFETSVDVEEFGRMQELLSGPAKMQTFLARKDGEAVGALVCSLLGDTAVYLLGATNERARELKASYLLHWQAMMWLKERGARHYDLGGIDPNANPGGYHFKSGFGGHEATQFPPHALSAGPLGDAVLWGVSWLRRRRKASATAAITPSH